MIAVDVGNQTANYFPQEEIQSLQNDYEQGWVKFVEERFKKMEEAKQEENMKIMTCRQLYERGLKAYKAKDSYNLPYRSARFFTAVQGWLDEYIENMPEAKLKPSSYRDSQAKEKAIAIEVGLKTNEQETVAEAEKAAMYEDVAKSGTGVLHEYYSENSKNQYTMWIDPLYFYIDEGARVFYGGDEGAENDARDCDWIRFMPYSTFFELYKNVEGFDPARVKPWEKTDEGFMQVDIEWNVYETPDMSNYFVKVHEYYNRELRWNEDDNYSNGVQVTIANGVLVEVKEAQTKKLPFSVYNHIKRNDSPYGIGVIEIGAPDIFALDTIYELAFRDAKLRLQRPIIGDANSGFHTGLKVGPGQMWSFALKPQRSIKDVVHQLDYGGIDSSFFNLSTDFLDNLTIAIQQDQRALFANPNQLATQTVAKKESFQKRVRSVIKRNLWAGEKNRMELRVEIFQNFTIKNNPVYDVEGYFILYAETDNPKFIKDSVGSGTFRATRANTDVICKVVAVEKSKQASLDEEERSRYMQFLQVVSSMKQNDTEGIIDKKIDFGGIIDAVAEKMNLDKRKYSKDSKDMYSDKFKNDYLRVVNGFAVSVPEDESEEELWNRLNVYKYYLETYGKNLTFKGLESITDAVVKVYEMLNNIVKSETLESASPEVAGANKDPAAQISQAAARDPRAVAEAQAANATTSAGPSRVSSLLGGGTPNLPTGGGRGSATPSIAR